MSPEVRAHMHTRNSRGSRLTPNIAMTPQEVQERLKLGSLKDRTWYVVPSCATTGEGLFEGLVCHS